MLSQTHGLRRSFALQQGPHEGGFASAIGTTGRERVPQSGVTGDDPLEAEKLVLDPVDMPRPLSARQNALHGKGLQRVGQIPLSGPAPGHALLDQGGSRGADLPAEEAAGKGALGLALS